MKELRFIHISKTGGQTIAISAKKQANIEWGLNDKEYGLGILCHKRLSYIPNIACDQYDWFMVIRNPYHRMVSEYNWSDITKIDINTYLMRMMSDVEMGYNDHGMHFTPQYLYLEKGCTIRVLRFENLDEEFGELMKEYGLSITLDKKINVSEKRSTIYDLTLETIELINRVYEKDFTTFGYEMVHSVFIKNDKISNTIV
jgi:hypothetical protein